VLSLFRERRVLNTTRSLDYDVSTPNLDHFILTVVANDSLNPSTLTVNVMLVDINDNSPIFSNDSYTYVVTATEKILIF